MLKTCVGVLLQVPSDKMKYELGPQFEGLSDTNTTHTANFFTRSERLIKAEAEAWECLLQHSFPAVS